MTDASFAVDAGTAVEPVARHRAPPAGRGAPARRRRRPGAQPCSRRRPRWPRRSATPTPSSTPNPSSRCSRWIVAAGPKPRHISTWRSPRSTSTGCDDYPTSVLAFAAAARLALHRGDLKETERQLTRAMRARPTCSFVHAVARGAGAAPPGQGVRGDRRPVDRSSPAPRDRRHPAPRPALGVLDDEVAGPSRAPHVATAQGSSDRRRRRSAPPSCVCSRTCRPTSRSARSASGCSCPATRSAPRSDRSTESSASRHAATRCNRRRRSGLLGG